MWQRDACKSNHRPHITSWPKQPKPQQNSTNWATCQLATSLFKLPHCQLASLPAFHLATLQLLQPAHALWLSINFMASPRHTAPSLVSDCVQPLVIKISLDHAKTLPENWKKKMKEKLYIAGKLMVQLRLCG